MSMRELDRLQVIQAVSDGQLARWRAAERLGISARHVRRLVLRLQEDGPSGLSSRKRGRDSNRQLPPGLESPRPPPVWAKPSALAKRWALRTEA